MKKSLLLLLLITIHQCLHAQSVGIGTNNPDSSAALEISSNNKGLLLPRINDTSSIKRPAKGLLVYNNNDNVPWYYDGNRWQKTTADAVMSADVIGMDSLWYKVQDTIAYTLHPYVQINTKLGLAPPQANLQVSGNFLVQPKLAYSITVSTAAQTYTMTNIASLQHISVSDSVFRVYDPGGAGNYNNNMQGNICTSSPVINGVGVKISSVAADFGLGMGDTLWIAYDVFPYCRTKYAYFFTNTTINPADFVVGGDVLYFIFRSNADGAVGKGFNFSVTRLYSLENYKKMQPVGPAHYFNSSNGAFGTGLTTNANGKSSVAMGSYTTANGLYSTAMGSNTIAGGNGSTAMGSSTTASGTYSTSMGYLTTASGFISTAIGNNTTASGDYSTAMGRYVSTNNHDGSFVIGDNSTTTIMNAANTNNFRARFAGGYKLFTSANLSTGCTLFAGDNAWTTGSSVHTKENFAAINGEDFLQKISGFHLTSWNYKTQNPATFRHYGPMAQDFYAAFGKDKYGTIGNDTTINSADFAGVSFVAIQALEKRTAEYKKEVDALKNENSNLKTLLLQLRKEVDTLQMIKK